MPMPMPMPSASLLLILLAHQIGSVSGSLLLGGAPGEAGAARYTFACAAALLAVFTRRGNLQRLRSGHELGFERARIGRCRR